MKLLLCAFFLVLGSVLTVAAQATQAVKLTGQIVCSQCWSEADRTQVAYGTQADLDCAKTCAAKGIPPALAVKNANGAGWTLYTLEDGQFKKPGKDWLQFMAKQAEISGTTRVAGEQNFLKVNDLRVLGDANAAANQAAEKLIGSEAELALKDLFGVEQKLSTYRGRIVVVNFWATWCGPCVKEMPELSALQNEYAAFGLQVIGAAADTTENLKEVRQFIKTAKINFPVWLGATTAEMARFGLGPALPGTAIIGRDGKIVAVFNGVITAAEVKKKLDQLIAKADKEAKEQLAAKKADPTEYSSVPS
jgi:thiol-disulfide isomerase/thioredoxin